MMLPNGELNAAMPQPRRRSWLSKTLTAAMLACFAVGGLFASQAAFKANGSVTAANSVAYCSPVAPPTGQALSSLASTGSASTEPQYLTKNVEDVQEGDYVLARDEHGHEIGYRKVVAAYPRTSYHLRHLKFRDDHGHYQTISTTDEHPFLDAEKNKFINAGDLPLCTKVTAPNGDLQTLVLSKREEHPAGIPVFNFQVEGFHTYYVHQLGTNVPVLVHNVDCLPSNARVFDNINDTFSHLNKHHGVTPEVASERLRAIKRSQGYGGADNVIVDRTGNVFNPITREFIGSLTQGGAR